MAGRNRARRPDDPLDDPRGENDPVVYDPITDLPPLGGSPYGDPIDASLPPSSPPPPAPSAPSAPRQQAPASPVLPAMPTYSAEQMFGPGQRYSSPLLDQLLTQMIANQTSLAQQRAAQEAENQVFRGKVRGNVLNMIERASKTPSLTDPTLAPQVQAYAGAAGRARQQGQERIGARRAAKGISQGGADAGIEQGFSELGTSTGGFNAGLLRDAYAQNRAELANALQLGAGLLSGDEERNLREQLATLDTEMGRLGLQTGAFTTTRGQDLSAGLQNYGLNLQNQQFYDRLGYDASTQEALINQMIIQQLLGQSA